MGPGQGGPGPKWAWAQVGQGPSGPGPKWARAQVGPGPSLANRFPNFVPEARLRDTINVPPSYIYIYIYIYYTIQCHPAAQLFFFLSHRIFTLLLYRDGRFFFCFMVNM